MLYPLYYLSILSTIVFVVWAVMDYNLSRTDKQESDDLARAIHEAYKKMEKESETQKRK